jgi:hypothetical protein
MHFDVHGLRILLDLNCAGFAQIQGFSDLEPEG